MKIIYRLAILLIFTGALVSIIAYARGYRFDIKQKSLTPTGILALSSSPKAAKVYINSELKGVTDLNLTLPPGQYTVEIKKEGYTDWSQKITLKGEIVTSLDTVLFPRNPSLSPSTNLGILKAVTVDQTDKVLLFSHNDDPTKDGVYLFDSNKRPLSFLPPLSPVVLESNLPVGIDLAKTNVQFSPDYRQAIFDFTTAEDIVYSYLITLDEENTTPFDITGSKDTVIDAWRTEKNQDIRKMLETFPPEITKVATDSFQIISFSPNETKMLYRAKKPVVIPLVIDPPLIGANQTPEERLLVQDTFYIYDRKEDKNIKIGMIPVLSNILTPTRIPTLRPTRAPVRITTRIPSVAPETLEEEILIDFATDGEYPVMWYPDSRHLVIEQEKEIIVIDYDGTNKRTVYSGPFEHGFFTVTTEGKLFILTNLNPQNNAFGDLYEIGIR